MMMMLMMMRKIMMMIIIMMIMMMMLCKEPAQVPMLCVPTYKIKLATMPKIPICFTFSAYTKIAVDKRGQT